MRKILTVMLLSPHPNSPIWPTLEKNLMNQRARTTSKQLWAGKTQDLCVVRLSDYWEKVPRKFYLYNTC